MPTICNISFNNPNGVYYAGQLLKGTAHLTTDHDKVIRAIHIEVNGYAKVKWFGGRRIKRIKYTAYEQYLVSRTIALGNAESTSFTLKPGNYEYQFRCLLPRQLPTSFDSQYGRICYEVVLTIDRPYRFDNVFKQAFTVIHQLNLNRNPYFRLPANKFENRTFCCFHCETGPLEVKLSIPYSGFAPGQKLHFTLLVANESNINVECSFVGLKKQIVYETTSPSAKRKYVSNYLISKSFDRLLRFNRKEYQEYLIIPPIPPTSTIETDGCKCIEIMYYLVAKVYPSGFRDNLKIILPITIGTVPLVNVIPIPPALLLPNADTDNEDGPPIYGTLEPPKYEDAIITENFVDPEEPQHKSGPFVPKYPVYRNNAAPNGPPTESIHICVSGYAKISWRDDRRENNLTSIYRYAGNPLFTNTKQLLSSRDYVVGSSYNSTIRLEHGSYEYPFECPLPRDLPTSFIGLLGYIKYEVILTIERPSQFDNIFKQAFTVIAPVDLNLYPECIDSGEISETKRFFCFCRHCSFEPFNIKLTTPRTGYVPGQKIHYKLSIKNETNVNISQICVGFNKKAIYEAKWPHPRQKSTLESIAKKSFGYLFNSEEKEFRGRVTLPAIPPSTMNNFKIIKFNYYLYAYVLTEGVHDNIKIVIPIILGTTPLINQPQTPETPALEMPINYGTTTPLINQPQSLPPRTPEIRSVPPETQIVILQQPRPTTIRPTLITSLSLEGDIPPSYESVLPPTYEEAIQLEPIPPEPEDKRYKSGPFTPKYPVYHNCDPNDDSDSQSDAD